MEKFIIGKKTESSQLFNEKGRLIPVTLVEAGPCKVLEVKGKEKDGYQALQLGYVSEKPGKIKKTMKGKEFRYIKEFRIKGKETEAKIGDWINVSMFAPGDKVKISGTSKGKGFQGGVKKWGFHGKNATHGNRHDERGVGSIGTSFPQRVIKGRHMPGRMGNERVTVKNLTIVRIDSEKNLLAIKGAIPGKNGSIVEIRG